MLVGTSHVFGASRELAERIARRRSSVMLLGETGSGKEMLARHIHEYSTRAAAPFVPVDCSCLSQGIFESELFGHSRGAFTGATRDTVGFIRSAHTGTLFLDEVGELGLPLQAKLLRVLQERRVTPVGDARSMPVDIRIISATHRDLGQMVRDGMFRQDLFFRLNVIVLHVPPLRERPEDILPLADHFLRIQAQLYDEPAKTLSAEAADLLKRYNWPGNARELGNVMEHAQALSAGPVITPADLPATVRDETREHRDLPAHRTLRDAEREIILETLKQTHYCKAAASRQLGINVRRLNRLIEKCAVPMP